MELGQIAESTSQGKTGSALLTIILAGVLWVGKTTFEHVGQITSLQHELSTAHDDYNLLRAQYDDIVGMLNERTKSRFTQEDAEKLALRIKEVNSKHDELKDGFLRDYTNLKIEIAAIGSSSKMSPAGEGNPLNPGKEFLAAQQLQRLEGEIANMQTQFAMLQHHLNATHNSNRLQPANTLAAQHNLNQVPINRR